MLYTFGLFFKCRMLSVDEHTLLTMLVLLFWFCQISAFAVCYKIALEEKVPRETGKKTFFRKLEERPTEKSN